MSSAICFNLDQSKILSSGIGLNIILDVFTRDIFKVCPAFFLSIEYNTEISGRRHEQEVQHEKRE